VADVPNIVHFMLQPHTETGYNIIYCNCLKSAPAATLKYHDRGGVGLWNSNSFEPPEAAISMERLYRYNKWSSMRHNSKFF